jgi:PTH2 family peptidyl-tRNA hydrolase
MEIENTKTKPYMYLFVNKGLGMSPGKMAAQVAHAAVESYIISDVKLRNDWRLPEKHYVKLVMEARNSEHLENIQKYLEDRNIKTIRIIDEGLTEIEPHQFTALGVEIVDKNIVGKTFDTFNLYKPEINIKVRFN